jgi:hypothetical protein
VMKFWGIARKTLGGIVAVALTPGLCAFGQSKPAPVGPGVRGGPAGAGTSLRGLTADETAFFQDGQGRFAEIEVVQGGSNNGLGARFNSNQCLSCHSQPAMGEASGCEVTNRKKRRPAAHTTCCWTMPLGAPAQNPSSLLLWDWLAAQLPTSLPSFDRSTTKESRDMKCW